MYLLGFILSLHSIIEGLALGIEDTEEHASTLLIGNFLGIIGIILVAILGHKFFSAFAFGVNLAKNNVPTDRLIRLVVMFVIQLEYIQVSL